MKIFIGSLCLAVAAAGVPLLASASDWQPVGKSVVDRAEYFLDLDTVKVRQGRLSGWVLTNYARSRFDAASASDLYSVDCAARTISHLNGGTYSEPYAQGKALSRYLGRSPRPEPVKPGTTGEQILTELCKAKPVL